MTAELDARAARRLSEQRMRWERMHIAIRCGLYADQPALLRAYLGLGTWLLRQGVIGEIDAHERMLELLVTTSRDTALPWFWRHMCLEYAARPMARLQCLLGQTQARLRRSLALVEGARRRLSLPSQRA